MMTVKEYATELGISVQEVLEKAKELGSKATSGTDILSEDDVIMLDNAINIISSDTGKISQREKRACWALLIKYEGETIYTSSEKKSISNIENIAILPRGSNYSWICTKQGRYIVVEFDADLTAENIITIPTPKSEIIPAPR